jgi:hypothetical protein
MTLPIICANIIFQQTQLTARHSPTRATATYELFIRQLSVPFHDCPPFFTTWKQIVYDLENGGPFTKCNNDLTVPPGFETYATFTFNTTRESVFWAHCGLHSDMLWTTSTKSGQGHSKILSQIIDISYHMCKFRITVDCLCSWILNVT